MKKVLAVLLAAVMVLSLAACSNSGNEPAGTTTAPDTTAATTPAATEPETEATESDDPEENLTIGRWEHHFEAEGYGTRFNYFHFYSEVPVLGKVFFASFSNNGMTFAGTYTVTKESMDWAAYPDRQTKLDDTSTDNSGKSKGTADYTVTFYNWNGDVLGKLPYDGKILYNTFADGEPMAAQGATDIFYLHDGAMENTFYDGELGQPFLSYVGDEDKTSTLQINHDGTYTDLVFAMVEGTYVIADAKDGGLEITLTPNDKTDTGAVVTTSADRKTCVYKQDGGDELAMHDANDETLEPSDEPAVEVYSTKATVNLGVDVEFTLSFFDDGTSTMSASMGGTDLVITGDWEIDDAHIVNFTNVSNGAFESKLAAQYKITWTGDLSERAKGVEVVFEFPAQDLGKIVVDPAKKAAREQAVEEKYSTKATVNLGIEVEFTLTFYSDNTAVMSASMGGSNIEITADWEVDAAHLIQFTNVSNGAFESKLASPYKVTWTGDLSERATGIEIVFEFPAQDLAQLN